MSILLSLFAAASYGLGDFNGGIFSRRGGAWAVSLVAQIGGGVLKAKRDNSVAQATFGLPSDRDAFSGVSPGDLSGIRGAVDQVTGATATSANPAASGALFSKVSSWTSDSSARRGTRATARSLRSCSACSVSRRTARCSRLRSAPSTLVGSWACRSTRSAP